jgi:hypothetical protein
MARQVLGGPSDSGRSSYQVSVTVCERCRQACQQSSGERLEVGPEIVAMAECDAQHLGKTHVGARELSEPERVTQSVPPSVRRKVLDRDGRKCSVPGCRHGQYLDLHHVTPRAEGGDHDPERLVTLCGVHHRAAHVGALVVSGRYSSGFVFRHADGKRYGGAVSPKTCELKQKVFLGLKGLGFRESDARRAIETAISGDGTTAAWTAESLLRKTLALLTR